MKSGIKKLVLLLTIVFLISADKAAEKVLISEVDYLDGFYKHGDRLVTGEIIDYYENDVLKFTYSALEGRLHGQATEYYPNGATRSVRNYKLNKLFGNYTEYFENGDIRVQFDVGLNAYGQGEKISDIKVAKGKKHRLKDYESGVLLFTGSKNESIGTSGEISILKQGSFKIIDEDKNTLLFKR